MRGAWRRLALCWRRSSLLARRAHAGPRTPKSTIDNFTFTPAELTVKVGTTVTWTNHDDIPHTVVAAGKFRSKALDTDDTYSFTFTTAGQLRVFLLAASAYDRNDRG